MPTTYYDVLGVDDDADQDAIRDAYREKVKEYHPDVSDHDDAEERFKRVKRAEIVLSDPEERETYDRLGHEVYVDGDEPETNEPTEDEVRWAAAQAARGNHDPGGGRSAGWRERERRARRTERAEWFGQSSDDGADDPFDDQFDTGSGGNEASDRNATATAGPKTGEPAADGWGSADGGSRGHSVHEWSPADQSTGIPRPDWSQDDVVLLASSILLYPILLFLTAVPAFPTAARVAIGICAIALVAFLLPRPSFGIPVFGTWSILLPVLLVSVGAAPLSVIGVVLLGGTWLPLGYSIAVAMVLVR